MIKKKKGTGTGTPLKLWKNLAKRSKRQRKRNARDAMKKQFLTREDLANHEDVMQLMVQAIDPRHKWLKGDSKVGKLDPKTAFHIMKKNKKIFSYDQFVKSAKGFMKKQDKLEKLAGIYLHLNH